MSFIIIHYADMFNAVYCYCLHVQCCILLLLTCSMLYIVIAYMFNAVYYCYCLHVQCCILLNNLKYGMKRTPLRRKQLILLFRKGSILCLVMCDTY